MSFHRGYSINDLNIKKHADYINICEIIEIEFNIKTERITSHQNIEILKSEIHLLIKEIEKNNRINIEDILEKIKNHLIKKELMDSALLLFEKNDNRVFNWAWCFLKRKIEIKQKNNENFHIELFSKPPYIYENLDNRFLEILNSSIEERKDAVIKLIENSKTSNDEKITLIEELKNNWSVVFKKNINIKWLDSHETENIKWIYNYIKESSLLELPFEPTSDSDYYWASLAAIDMCNNDKALELLLLKLKKTLSQKKYREKESDRKFYSIGMTEETKKQLDTIVKIKKSRINLVIEELISNEFKNSQ